MSMQEKKRQGIDDLLRAQVNVKRTAEMRVEVMIVRTAVFRDLGLISYTSSPRHSLNDL